MWDFMISHTAVSRLESNFFPHTDYVVQLQAREWGHKQVPYSMGPSPLVRVSLTRATRNTGGEDGVPGAGWRKRGLPSYSIMPVHIATTHVVQAEARVAAASNFMFSTSCLPPSLIFNGPAAPRRTRSEPFMPYT